jgi:hypothetical protein
LLPACLDKVDCSGTVKKSTTEAEYIAAAGGVRVVLWMKILCVDLDLPLSQARLQCDNQACIKIIKNPFSSARSKHIDIQHHFVRERVTKGEVAIEHCMTQAMVADVLSKPVARTVLFRLRGRLGVQ